MEILIKTVSNYFNIFLERMVKGGAVAQSKNYIQYIVSEI